MEEDVRARKSPWIETMDRVPNIESPVSGLVRARGLKRKTGLYMCPVDVRARKSPWIETMRKPDHRGRVKSGLVRARGLKQIVIAATNRADSQGS